MRLPLGRALPYGSYPFVQAVHSRGLARVPRHALDATVRAGRAPLIADFGALRSASFEPALVHPILRRFYESAERHHMRVEWLRWEPWAAPLSGFYVPLARRLGNLCVPSVIDGGVRMSSSVQHLTLPDGGSSRRWVRTLSGTCSTFYVAALRTWVDAVAGATYLSLAFPYPWSHVMVLLRVCNEADGLVVSTRGDELAGTYLIVPRARGFVALPGPPTDEVLTFWVEGDSVIGHHEDFLGPRRTFALRYRIEL